jgi:hypothetical protein
LSPALAIRGRERAAARAVQELGDRYEAPLAVDDGSPVFVWSIDRKVSDE